MATYGHNLSVVVLRGEECGANGKLHFKKGPRSLNLTLERVTRRIPWSTIWHKVPPPPWYVGRKRCSSVGPLTKQQEDGAFLAVVIGEVVKGTMTLPNAISLYEKERRPLADIKQQVSYMNGAIWHLQDGSTAQLARDAAMAPELQGKQLVRSPNLYSDPYTVLTCYGRFCDGRPWSSASRVLLTCRCRIRSGKACGTSYRDCIARRAAERRHYQCDRRAGMCAGATLRNSSRLM